MPAGLIDATTLISFWKAGSVDVLATVFGGQPPCWCAAVKSEIERGPRQQSQDLLDCDWLAATAEPDDLVEVIRLRAALAKPGDKATAHLGEAESIAIAAKRNIVFVTDDFAAYDFATRKMKPEHVWDSVRVLQEAVTLGALTADEAVETVQSIRDNGRYLRRTHPDPFTIIDFSRR